MALTAIDNTGLINGLVSKAVDAGLLRKVPAMNPPGADYETRDTFVGRTAAGDRVYLDLRLAYRAGEAVTTNHETVTGRWELSLSGGSVDKGRKGPDKGGDWSTCGQIRETFAKVIGVRGVRAVAAIWDTDHLNGMTAGCEHQTRAPGDADAALDNTPACPVTGYRWGTAWLYRELPAAHVQTVLEFLDAARTRYNDAVRAAL
jgi:hypothetical protein